MLLWLCLFLCLLLLFCCLFLCCVVLHAAVCDICDSLCDFGVLVACLGLLAVLLLVYGLGFFALRGYLFSICVYCVR